MKLKRKQKFEETSNFMDLFPYKNGSYRERIFFSRGEVKGGFATRVPKQDRYAGS